MWKNLFQFVVSSQLNIRTFSCIILIHTITIQNALQLRNILNSPKMYIEIVYNFFPSILD